VVVVSLAHHAIRQGENRMSGLTPTPTIALEEESILLLRASMGKVPDHEQLSVTILHVRAVS